ncbi:hypothetical protein UT300019_19250 [Clostridium sp. CTA-19]
MNNNKFDWYVLDNAGKLYPSIMSWRVTTVFRISATLTVDIEPKILQRALNKTINKFPFFKVNLKPGLFWYYFDYVNFFPTIEKETYYPCTGMELKKKGNFPFKILYYNKKISLEFSHCITDGHGALIFMKNLLYEYFYFKNIIKETKEINNYSSNLFFEDSFKKHFNPDIPSPSPLPFAFHFPMELDSKGIYYIVTGSLPLDKVLSICKSKNATVTEFFLAVYFDTILDYIKLLERFDLPFKKSPIILNVPVNLRKIYNSKTLRNFFISITPMIDPRLGEYTFDELLTYIKSYMYINTDKKQINQHISKNVKTELFFLNRAVPLIFKNLFLPIAYSTFAEGHYTSGLSNLGKITIPKELYPYIEKFEAYPPPSEGNKIKLVLLSFKKTLYITFGKVTTDSNIERIFFNKLRKMGIPIKIETN